MLILYIFNPYFPSFFFSSLQWEKLQKDDTDPGQLKGIKESVETVTRDTSSMITRNQDTKVYTKEH